MESANEKSGVCISNSANNTYHGKVGCCGCCGKDLQSLKLCWMLSMFRSPVASIDF